MVGCFSGAIRIDVLQIRRHYYYYVQRDILVASADVRVCACVCARVCARVYVSVCVCMCACV